MSTIVGIAGGSASGKSTLTRLLTETARPGELAVVGIDSFYFSLRPDERPEEINYDHPNALDFERLHNCLDELVSGSSTEIPIYDFSTHTRVGERTQQPAPLLIVEGILALSDVGVRERLHLKVFVTAPESARFQRRLHRDMHERGRSESSVREQWQRTVEPMHREFVERVRGFADIVVDGTLPFDEAVHEILEHARLR